MANGVKIRNRMRLRPALRVQGALLLAFALVLASCAGQDGSSYQKFRWAGSLGYLYDTNPSTGSTVYTDTFSKTDAGSFYLQYQAYDGSEWYAYYTITVDKGKPILENGDDLWFEIDLLSTGPTLYQWSSAKALGEGTEAAPATEVARGGSPEAVNGDHPRTKPALGPIVRTETFHASAGTVVLKVGQVLGR